MREREREREGGREGVNEREREGVIERVSKRERERDGEGNLRWREMFLYCLKLVCCRYNLGGYDCSHCFQLLGIDVILDINLHPVVIEVSTKH